MRKYNIVVVDDEYALMEKIILATKNLLESEYGIDVSYKILSRNSEIQKMNDFPGDILLFDCAMGTTDLNFGNSEEDMYGLELMKLFRKKNKRTKIIFYSGRFTLDGTSCYDFTNSEMLQLINSIHIYKMIPKSVEEIKLAILDAIEELDSVISGLECLKFDYESEGFFRVNNENYSIQALLDEIKKGTSVGEEFKAQINELLLSYLMKFGGDES